MGWVVAIAAMCLVAFVVREIRIWNRDKALMEQERKQRERDSGSTETKQ